MQAGQSQACTCVASAGVKLDDTVVAHRKGTKVRDLSKE